MRAKSFVLTIIASLSLPNTDYFLDQEWLQPYRFNGNSVEYSLDDYNIKEVVPYEKEEGEDTVPTYEAYKSSNFPFGVNGNETSMNSSKNSITTAGISSEDAANGISGNLSLSNFSGLEFPFRGTSYITSLFGWRWLSGRGLNFHEGLDVVGENKTVYASGSGKVVAANKNVSTGHGYGLYVAVEYTSSSSSSKSKGKNNHQDLSQYARNLARNTRRPLSGNDLNTFQSFLDNPNIQNEIKAGEDKLAIELCSTYIDRLIKTYPKISDPRTLLLAADMENTGSHHVSYMPSVQSMLGTSNEFEAVYNAMMTKSWWANPPSGYQQYSRGWKKRMTNTYNEIKNKKFSSNLKDDSLKLELASLIFSGEGNYNSINPNDVGYFSFGICGFREGHAATVLNYIADAIDGNLSSSMASPSGEKLYLFYAHLSKVNVSVGDVVDSNTALGVEGATGNVTGSHLHLSGYVDHIDSVFELNRIWKRPSTSSPTENIGCIDPLSKIFHVSTQEEFKKMFGFLLQISGASGSYKDTLNAHGSQYYKANEELSITPEKWNSIQ